MNSGLNPYEITRIVKDIEQSGITENEKYDKEIQKTVKDSTSNKCAHVVYIWSKDRDEEDVLNIKFIKKK